MTRYTCRTVLVRPFNDGSHPRYAVVGNATVVLGTGPNGDYIGGVDEVSFEGVTLKPDDDLFVGEWFDNEVLYVTVEDGTATIEREADRGVCATCGTETEGWYDKSDGIRNKPCDHKFKPEPQA